ncbi:hypothetical protein [Niabella aurantiaca]|uniref:hypothetical protein n=1 Tax=Niabella aurantiaca TaxID=379900 RepID=UPI00037AD546|nr:hypothetical protein [Niabella aurantiaca]
MKNNYKKQMSATIDFEERQWNLRVMPYRKYGHWLNKDDVIEIKQSIQVCT